MGDRRVGIVGGGIVGLAIGREFLRRRPGTSLIIYERESRLAGHQTGHNSGVVHAGIYYPPGSLKAQLCTRGRLLLRDFCVEHGLAYEECGKLVVAVGVDELGRLDALEQKATANQVPGLRRIERSEIAEIEPHGVGLAALHSPATAITDYPAVAETIGAEIRAGGGVIRLNTAVTGLQRRAAAIEVRTGGPGGEGDEVDRLIICAGLQADRVARLAGGAAEPRIVPFRGDYLRVLPPKDTLVRGMIYPVPDPRYPFLGVHFTRRVTGGLEVGPNAVLALRRDGYGRFDLRPADIASMVSWPGFWSMARRHWRTGLTELHGALSLRAYLRTAQRYVPEIGTDDVVRSGSGVRAQAVDRAGGLVDDFRIDDSDGITAIRNAPSPAATSSLAIAEHVLDRIVGP